jgi:hypothetical protein
MLVLKKGISLFLNIHDHLRVWISTKKGGKKPSLMCAEALSGALLPRFGGARAVSVQTASMRWKTSVGRRSMGGATWRDGFHRQPGRKGNMCRLRFERN